MTYDKGLLRAAIDQIEKIAFQIPAPNVYTPQIVQICQAIRAEASQPASQPDCVAVPVDALLKLKEWNDKFPSGKFYDISVAYKMERELQEAIAPLLRAAKQPQ